MVSVNPLFFLAVLFLISINMNSQNKVHDPHKRRQLESMVFQKWDRKHFRPKWYYRLFHNGYRKGKDRRYIHQHLPNITTSKYQRKNVEKSKDSVKQIHQVFNTNDLDWVLNPKYVFLFKDEYVEIYSKIFDLHIEYQLIELKKYYKDFHPNFEHSLIMRSFKERQLNIKNSYRPSVEKNQEYTVLLQELETYYQQLIALKRKIRIAIQNYKYTYHASYKITP